MRATTRGGSPFGPQVLPDESELDPEDDEAEYNPFKSYLFDDEDGEDGWPALRFELICHNHGGSGLNMNWGEAENLDVADIPDTINRLREHRRREAQAIRNARGGK